MSPARRANCGRPVHERHSAHDPTIPVCCPISSTRREITDHRVAEFDRLKMPDNIDFYDALGDREVIAVVTKEGNVIFERGRTKSSTIVSLE